MSSTSSGFGRRTWLIFGFAVRTDVQDIAIAIVDPTPDVATLELRERVAASDRFDVVAVTVAAIGGGPPEPPVLSVEGPVDDPHAATTNATRPGQWSEITELASLGEVPSPAVIVVGEAAALASSAPTEVLRAARVNA